MKITITCRRKCSKLVDLKVQKCDETVVFINKKNWSQKKKDLSQRSQEVLITDLIIKNLKGIYKVEIRGGGLMSQISVLQKALLTTLNNKTFEKIKKQEPELFFYDNRRVLPKRYGGPGSRARYQKSYR